MGSQRKLRISDNGLTELFEKVEQNLIKGLSSKAEKILTDILEKYNLTADNKALVEKHLSYTLETLGRYKESLAVLDKYDYEDLLAKLETETQIRVLNQLAISLSNTNGNPKAVTLLNYSLEIATKEDLTHFFGEIYVLIARVYRKLNEYQISRDNANKGLTCYREQGSWLGMAHSYHTIAMTYHCLLYTSPSPRD